MKRVIVFALGALLGATGCISVETAKLPGPESGTHVFVRNYGKYLFNFIPIWCGNASDDPVCDFVMFRDDVTTDKMYHRFLTECHKKGQDVSEITCHMEEDVFIRLPIWSIEIPLPYIWTHHEIQISGVVK